MSTPPHGFLRVGAACPRVWVADPARNVEEILRLVEAARAQAPPVLVFPERGLTAYTAGDLFFSLTTLVGGAERALARLLQSTAGHRMTVAVGLPVALDGKLFNCAAVIQAGRLVGVVPKTYLPGYKEYYEERWFASAREALRDEVRLAGQAAPFGTNLLFAAEDEPAVTLGVEICEALWSTVQPSSFHALAGATILANLSASNEIVAKAENRRDLVKGQPARAGAPHS